MEQNLVDLFSGLEQEHTATPGSCLENTNPPSTQDIFLRKINKKKAKDNDFKPKLERNYHNGGKEAVEKLLANHDGSICDLYSVSVTKLDANNKHEALDAFIRSLHHSPGTRFCYIKFAFKQGVGSLKYTPCESNGYHHDFFKSSNFDFQQDIVIAETIEFQDE